MQNNKNNNNKFTKIKSQHNNKNTNNKTITLRILRAKVLSPCRAAVFNHKDIQPQSFQQEQRDWTLSEFELVFPRI